MISALVNLIVVLIVAGVLYWALNRLWPLGAPVGTQSAIGQVIYVILIVIGVLAIVFIGAVPVIQSIPATLSSFRF